MIGLLTKFNADIGAVDQVNCAHTHIKDRHHVQLEKTLLVVVLRLVQLLFIKQVRMHIILTVW